MPVESFRLTLIFARLVAPISQLLRNLTVLKHKVRPTRLELPISFLYIAVGAAGARGGGA